MGRLRSTAAALVLSGLVVCGCSGSDSGDGSAPGSDAAAATSIPSDFSGGVDGPVMFAPGPPNEDGEDAGIGGVLVRDGECLYVGDGAADKRFAVVWPFGTTWDADAQAVIAPDGTQVPIGSTLRAAGGYGAPENLSPLLGDEELAERARACLDGGNRELAIVQHGSRWAHSG